MPDIVLTGLPRAGSAVLGALVDYLPDTLCLNAPAWHLTIARRLNSALPFGKWLIGDYAWQRLQLLKHNPVADHRAPDGTPLFDGLHEHMRTETPIVRESLSPDFTLAMRHTTLFTAVLPIITECMHFRIIAVIRNPVDILLSWQQHPEAQVAPGNPHALLNLWPEAHAIATSPMDELDRLAQMAELFFRRYHALQSHIEIIKYEDIVTNPALLCGMFGCDRLPANTVRIAAPPMARMADKVEPIRTALRKYGACMKEFYNEF